jgi:hypothetical protein
MTGTGFFVVMATSRLLMTCVIRQNCITSTENWTGAEIGRLLMVQTGKNSKPVGGFYRK